MRILLNKGCAALLGLAFAGACLTGCSAHSSPQQAMVADRSMVYEDTYKAYREAEKDYINLLENLERMPEEEELWMMKRDRMLELNQLKELMLTARQDFDESMRLWEMHLMDVHADVKQSQMKQYNPNFKGTEAKRSSPGQLLPEDLKKPASEYK